MVVQICRCRACTGMIETLSEIAGGASRNCVRAERKRAAVGPPDAEPELRAVANGDEASMMLVQRLADKEIAGLTVER